MIINKKNFLKSSNSYYSNKPFNHFIIDDFFNIKIAKKLEKQFPDYNSKILQSNRERSNRRRATIPKCSWVKRPKSVWRS